ncbi:MAG: transposase [Anaerolineaceae bacterium]|nr:transposase [Anaerolineaceae bacterium]
MVWIIEPDDTVRVERCSTPRAEQRSAPTIKNPPRPGSLSVIVRAYKSAVAYRINQKRHSHGNLVWQRNYYEHVIRDDNDLDAISAYIFGNPSCWETDDPFRAPPSLSTRRIINPP